MQEYMHGKYTELTERKGDHSDECVSPSPHLPHYLYLPRIVAYIVATASGIGLGRNVLSISITKFFRRCVIMDKHMAVRVFSISA